MKIRDVIFRLLGHGNKSVPPIFDHKKAQAYEIKSAFLTIQDHFKRVYSSWENAREKGSLWQSADDQWFQGNNILWQEFVNYVQNKKGLEIGSGPFGYLAPCYWIKNRVIIDPLIDEYRNQQIKKFGKTFFGNDIVTFNINAEQFISELKSNIDGFIVCRNALDHCEDPLMVLENISQYAAPGCFLLLWTDLWHLAGCDEGHTNITRSTMIMDKVIRGMGFEIIQKGSNIRDYKKFIEYGVLARKPF